MKFSKKKYVVELDGQLFEYLNGRLVPLEDLSALSGRCHLITDMQDGLAKSLTVDAPARYVELMVRRKLQESGEFEEPVTVVTHWKKARGKNSTDVFFTAVPTRLFLYYTEQLSERQDSIIVFPLYAILYNALKRLSPKKPVALVFQHGRFADLLIGNSQRVYYAIQCNSFDVSKEQLLSLWDTVLREIQVVENEHRMKVSNVYAINWIDSGPLPSWDDQQEKTLTPMPAAELLLENEILSVSFLKAINELSQIRRSISPFKEKLFFKTAFWAPVLMGVIFILALGLFGAGITFSRQTTQLKFMTAELEQQYNQIRSQIPTVTSVVDYKPTLNFIKGLASYQKMPPFKEVIIDLSQAMSKGMTLEVLKLSYSEAQLQLELFGPIKAPFDQAHAGYQHFLKVLKQQGYLIVESKFDTVIDESQILIKIVKRWE